MTTLFRDYALLLAITGLVFFLNLGASRLWDRDEPRNAGCTAEMLARNDWVTPWFKGELRSHKPVLLYWFMMTAYGVFGQSEFAARFWSAALGMGTVLLTYHIGQRLYGRAIGIWGAIALATALMFDVASRAATPDGLLIFLVTAALATYVHFVFPPRIEDESAPPEGEAAAARESSEPAAPLGVTSYFPESILAACAIYAIMGLGVLAKGPVGLVLPTAVIGMFLLIVWARGESLDVSDTEELQKGRTRRKKVRPVDAEEEESPSVWSMSYWMNVLGIAWGQVARVCHPLHFLQTCIRMQPLVAIGVVLLVAAPWYVWVGLRTDGAWLAGFFGEHNLQRATEAMEGHSGSIFYYPIAVLCGFFPWSIFAIPTVLLLWNRLTAEKAPAERDADLFLACWVGVWIGIFSLASTKLPSYITPCYPAIALLTGVFVDRFLASEEWQESWWPRISFGSLAIVGLVLIIALPFAAARFLPGDEWLGAIGAVPLIGGIAALILLEFRRAPAAIWTLSGTAVAFCTLLFGWGTVVVDGHQESDRLITAIRDNSADPQIAAYAQLESSWVYYTGKPIQFIKAGQPEAAGDFLAKNEQGFVITTTSQFEKLRGVLPNDVQILAKARYFLKNDQLVVLGRSRPQATAAKDGGIERK